MSWTDVLDWTPGLTVTAGHLDTYLSANMLAMLPASSTITTTGTQTLLALPDGRGDLILFCNNASTLTIQGITAGYANQCLRLFAIGAGRVELVNESGSASAANRLANGVTGTRSLMGGGSAILVYHSASPRWRVLDHQQGGWITPTFSAGDFTGSSNPWGVDAGDVTTMAHRLDGRSLLVAFALTNTSPSSGSLSLQINKGQWGSFTAAKQVTAPIRFNDNGTKGTGYALVTAGGSDILCRKSDDTNWAASTNVTEVIGQLEFEVQ